MKNKILLSLLTIIFITPAAMSLGISDYNFGQVQQGQVYHADIPVFQSANDFINDFTIETDGDMAGWLLISPTNFSLEKGESQTLNITLTVPEGAKPGNYNGSITAVGHRPIPGTAGGNVGYTVATLSRIQATAIKNPSAPGAGTFAVILVILTAAAMRRKS